MWFALTELGFVHSQQGEHPSSSLGLWDATLAGVEEVAAPYYHLVRREVRAPHVAFADVGTGEATFLCGF